MKLHEQEDELPGVHGRPFTGAWIETMQPTLNPGDIVSPLHGGVD